METWKLMEEKEIDISRECYYLAIQALCKGGYLNEAFRLMNIMRDNPSVHYFLPIYNKLLGACVQMHNISYVNQCLDLMDHQMVGKNEITYYQLLKLAVFQQNLPAVHEIWKECTNLYKPSIIFLRKFIWSFSKLRDMESAYLTLQQMVDMVFQGGFLFSKTAEGKMRNLRLDIPAPCKGDSSLLRSAKENEGFMHSANRYYNDMGMHASTSEHYFNIGNIKKNAFDISKSTVRKQKSIAAMKLLKWSFSDVMHACAVMQNDVLAEQLLYQMQSLGLQPSRQTYNAFTMAVLNARGFHDAIEVVKIMEKKNMKPYDSTLVCLSVSCSRNLELDLAESFLDQISTFEGPYPFNAFLEACDALDLPERAVQSLTKMKKLNIQPDIRTYELLFSLFGSVNSPFMEENLMFQNDAAKQIRAIDMDMMKNGVQHSQLSMMNLLKALGTRGLVKEMIQFLQAAENPIPHYQSSLGTSLYNTVLHVLVRAKETNAAISIFKGMISCGASPDAATYTIMIDCCTIIDNFKSACTLVSRMIRDGFVPQIFTYTSLIKILVESEDFDKAFRLLNQGILDGIQPDVLLYNRIVQKASEKGRIDVIELFVEQMHRDRVQPNSSICRNVFFAYVDGRFYKTAIEALQVLSMRMISLDDNVLDERQAEYEHLILNEETEDETKITNLFIEDGREDHSVALLILRWCAILGFPISWTSNKSQWAKRLSMNYDRSILVADDNSESDRFFSTTLTRRQA
ncbi:pentatricopeptide repeat-containing protein At1g76280 isoform X2 [Ipomoea triloba]|nr:pentatricopeptide repeat-containing protein At1g76280 isoform X2 [Ipomoea triloba]XP_031123105.1 pentatricopeptide repeat-containing protein At1g76280 isoform X2 [Ipomoea triloba]